MFIRRKDPDGASSATLVARTVAFALGAGLGLAGMALDIAWLINAAIVVLIVAFALRFAGRDEGEASLPQEES